MTLLRFLSVALFCLVLQPVSRAQEAGIIPGDILVMITADGSAQRIADDLRMIDGQATGLYVDHEVSAPMRIWLLKFDHQSVAQQRMLHAVSRHPQVIMAQNDHPVTFRNMPDDPQYSDQWHHDRIQSEMAWTHSTGGVTSSGDTIVVCIIEGANLLHPDLEANRWLNHAEIPGNGIDDDGNGYVDDHRGWNPVAGNDNVYSGGHGTNVAGMIGAVGNNGLGMVGANWNVKMMVVTVGSLSQANVIASYTYPLVMRRRYNQSNGSEGAFVVATNASWGIDNGNPADYPLWCAMYDTLGTAGILNCGATTNSELNVDIVGDLPTGCASDFMVSVTATNSNDMRTFSGFGTTTIDVGAPGANVFTTSGTDGYISTSGTSFASPLTAGVIGLLYSAPCPSLMELVHADPTAGALYVRQMLFDGVDQVGNLPGNTVTGGRINAGNSMQLLVDGCGACPGPYSTSVQVQGQDTLRLQWNYLDEGVFIVRHRPLGSEDWTEVENVTDVEFLVSGLSICASHEFQVGVVCGNEVIFSGMFVYQPQQLVQPQILMDELPAICAGASITLASSNAGGNVWNTGETTTYIEVTAPGIYTVTTQGPCGAEVSEPVEVILLDPAMPVAGPAVVVSEGEMATLTAAGDSILWYNVPVGGDPIGAGSSWETMVPEGGASFWCSNILYSDPTPPVFGGAVERSSQGQYHNNGNFHLRFTANQSFVIRSVKVFANGPGGRAIGLYNSSGNPVAQGTYFIPDGESRVQLDLLVPAAGQYSLRIVSGNPQLWRDGLGSVLNFPYSLGAYGSITSSSTTINATAYYYFFYDWEVGPETTACESDRVEVVVQTVVGIYEHSRTPAVSVHPNPASDLLYVDLGSLASHGSRAMRMLDIAGKEVAMRRLVPGMNTVPVNELAQGTYQFQLLEEGTVVGHGRFIIAR